MNFKDEFTKYIPSLIKALQSDEGKEWIVKGFIDLNKKIYPMTDDTKVVSKLIEIILLPYLEKFASDHGYKIELPEHQNHYPDITFSNNKLKFAVDIKTTYRLDNKNDSVNGMTLGCFTGYFRQRNQNKNILYPYEEYNEHYVLGVIYSRTNEKHSNDKIFSIDDLQNIKPPIFDFFIFFQEKYRIATDKPGSGNTKNIGSEHKLQELIKGNGIFVRTFKERAKEMFDKYWVNYETLDMAKAQDRTKPQYKNLKTFQDFFKI